MAGATSEINANRNSKSGLGKITEYDGKTGPFKTIITFSQYSYRGAGKPFGSTIGAIALPLPESLVDTFDIKVNSDEVGFLGALAAQGASTNPNDVTDMLAQVNTGLEAAAKDLGRGVAQAAQGNFDAFGKTSNVAKYAVRKALASIAPSAVNGFEAGAGVAANPFATLVFSGVNLKTYSFTWTLSPETQADSDKIQQIIEQIREAILPEYASVAGSNIGIEAIDRGLLTYPAMAQIKFQGINSKYYFETKKGMISNFTVDYSPGGISVIQGGKPHVVKLSMQFTEAYIRTRGKNDPTSTDSTGGEGAPEDVSETTENTGIADAVQGNTNIGATGDGAQADVGATNTDGQGAV